MKMTANFHIQILTRSLIGIVFASLLMLNRATPARAFLGPVLDVVLRRDSGNQAGNRAKGGGPRDESCVPKLQHREDQDQLVALVPSVPMQTTRDRLDIFLYVPIDNATSKDVLLAFELSTQADGNTQSELMLVTRPTKSGVVRFQFPLPSSNSLETAKTYEWSFQMICRETQPAPREASEDLQASQLAIAPLTIDDVELGSLNGYTSRANYTIFQEVFGSIQRIEATGLLENKEAGKAYTEYDGWVDMISVLSAGSPQQLVALPPICLSQLNWPNYPRLYEQLCSR